MKTPLTTALLLASAALLPSTLQADVVSYTTGKNIGYLQDSILQPTTPTSFSFAAQIVASPSDVFQSTSLSFNRPPLQNITLPSQTQGPPATANGIGFAFTSEAAVDADFPSTTYTFTADRGFGTETGSLFMPDGLYTTTIPHFTGTTWLQLQLFDPSQLFTGTINGFTPNPGANSALTRIAVQEIGPPSQRAFTHMDLTPGDTSFSIPAGTLDPGTEYVISLFYINGVRTEDAGFGGAADSVAGFTRVTGVTFTTVPEPSNVALLLLGAGLFMWRKFHRRAA